MAEQATIDRAVRAFTERFGGAPDLVAQAPGRVNLIGEHTDYNDGFALPMAIDRGTVVAARVAGANVHVLAADLGAEDQFDPALIDAEATNDWRDYVRGVVALLAAEGAAPPGLALSIAGDVPQGAGLSSSASLEVATGFATAILGGAAIDRTHLACIGQRAENDYAGCACGVMDQLVSARAEAGHALLIDCRSLECSPVTLPDEAAVLIIHSGVERGLIDSAYNERRRQCEQAAAFFGVPALRDVTPAQIEVAASLDPVVRRRARHVVTENARTLAAADALTANDMMTIGRLMAESQTSMREDFEITVPAVDALVALLQREIGAEGGARMTGGGFGGCVVALLPQQRVAGVSAAVRRDYSPPNGKPLFVHCCRPAAGVGPI